MRTIPPFYQLVAQQLVDEARFSFRLGKTEADGGEVILGGIDENSYTGEIYYVPVKRKAYWEVPVASIALGLDKLELSNTGAAIDTGDYSFFLRAGMISYCGHRHFTNRSFNRYCRDDK